MTSANAIVELMKIPAEAHDLAWLKRALQAAVQLEFATIPPYLSAYWSIKDLDGDIASTILGIALDEMRHMGLVCNLLAGLGEQPKIAQPDVVPSYPGYLPGGVHPDLIVALRGLSRETASTFTSIELPKKPLAVVETLPHHRRVLRRNPGRIQYPQPGTLGRVAGRQARLRPDEDHDPRQGKGGDRAHQAPGRRIHGFAGRHRRFDACALLPFQGDRHGASPR